jgi:hypothetical protein
MSDPGQQSKQINTTKTKQNKQNEIISMQLHLGLQTALLRSSATPEQIARPLLLKSQEGLRDFQILLRSTAVNPEEGSYHLQLISSISNLHVFYPHVQKTLNSGDTQICGNK